MTWTRLHGHCNQGNRPATELPSAVIRELLADRTPLLAARGAPLERLRAQLPLPLDNVVGAGDPAPFPGACHRFGLNTEHNMI